MHSCIYEGIVTHRRREPVAHQFQNRLFMVYLDLNELPSLVGRGHLISNSEYASCSFQRRDHLFDRSQSLATELRHVIHRETGCWTNGPIRILTQLRCLGYYFSPLNLFYVYDDQGDQLEYIVAEVNNTPWNERHCYVLWDGNRASDGGTLSFAHPKQFHVSPFMDMAMDYRWQLTQPDSTVTVRLANQRGSRVHFEAAMHLQRRELDRQQLRYMTLRYPLMNARIIAAIYYQAWKLWWKKCPSYVHPKKLNIRPLGPVSSARASTKTKPAG